MPKGVKEKDAIAPARVRCDFCGKPFAPKKWNSRTCDYCREVRGAPDQAETINYEKVLDTWLKKNGKRVLRKQPRRQPTTRSARRGGGKKKRSG